jgi:hypothetical protein
VNAVAETTMTSEQQPQSGGDVVLGDAHLIGALLAISLEPIKPSQGEVALRCLVGELVGGLPSAAAPSVMRSKLLFRLPTRDRATLTRMDRTSSPPCERRARTSCLDRSGYGFRRSDVTEPQSIAAAIEASGPVDVLMNNAGIGLIGVFEATPMATVRQVFETDTSG